MRTFLDYAIWALTILAPPYVCGHAVVGGRFHGYVPLNLFMLPFALLSPGRLNPMTPTVLLGCWSPLAWADTFTRTREEARLVPAWVALGPPR